MAEPSLETPDPLKTIFSQAVAGLTYNICLWLYCMRRQFNTANAVDRSWQLHFFVLDPRRHQSDNHETVLERYTTLTGKSLTPAKATSLLDIAIDESNKKFKSLAQKQGYTFKTFRAFLRLTDALDSTNYAECVDGVAELCLTCLEDNTFNERIPLIRLCFNREGSIIEWSIRELLRMKDDGLMAIDSECCKAFRLLTVAYCGFQVQDELENKIPLVHRIARSGDHPLAKNRRLFVELVQSLYCGPLRSTFEGMGVGAWWTMLADYHIYAAEMRQLAEAEEDAGNG